jgi:hypothetical protein
MRFSNFADLNIKNFWRIFVHRINIQKAKKNFVPILGLILSFLFFYQVIKADSPDNPNQPPTLGANIGIIMQGVDLSNPNVPKINWVTYNNLPYYYWVQVAANPSFSSPAVSVIAAFGYVYNYVGGVDSQPNPRCSCDTSGSTNDCATSFSASASDPSTCYDWYSYVYSYQQYAGQSYVEGHCYIGESGVPEHPFFCYCSLGSCSGTIYLGEGMSSPYATSCSPGCSVSWSFSIQCWYDVYQTVYATAYKSRQFNKSAVPASNTSQSYSISSGLTPGQTYYARVAVNDSRAWTPWVCPATGSFLYNPNNAPSASGLSSYADYCLSSSLRVFSWNYSDPDSDPQAAYQVQIAENPGFSPIAFDSGKIYSSSYSYTANSLSLNKTYYWRLMVWDSRETPPSPWITGPSFSTPSHAYPTADFTWFPDLPYIGESVLFMDKSRAYGGANISGWNWTIPDANYVAPSASASQNPAVRFTSEGDKNVILQATDSDGFSCSIQKTARVNLSSPCWKEISPSP